jgi:Uncharacterised protein family (UPF0158)
VRAGTAGPDWEGDAHLATQVEAVFGWGPVPLVAIASIGSRGARGRTGGRPDHGVGRIDLQTGEVWPQSVVESSAEEAGDEEVEDADDDERWLRVHCEGSRAGYRDMELFIDSMEDGHVVDRLVRSIQGRGAFRRFKDTLANWPHFLDRWYGFTDDRLRGRARAWLVAEGFTPAPPLREP